MKSDMDNFADEDELQSHIWKEDTIIVNGQQMTIMYPPETAEDK